MKANKIHHFPVRYSATGASHARAWILDNNSDGTISVIEIERTSTTLRPFTVARSTDHVVVVTCGTERGARTYIARHMCHLRQQYPLLTGKRSSLARLI